MTWNHPSETIDDVVSRAARALAMMPDARLLAAWAHGVADGMVPLEAYPEPMREEFERTARAVVEYALKGTFTLECPHGDFRAACDAPEEAQEQMQTHVQGAHAELLERTCPGCGCYALNACLTRLGPCSWDGESPLCSGCRNPEILVRGPLLEDEEQREIAPPPPPPPRIILPGGATFS